MLCFLMYVKVIDYVSDVVWTQYISDQEKLRDGFYKSYFLPNW